MFPLFCLCRHNETRHCKHNDEERCIVGTWGEDEVRKAIEIGYGLMNVFEFWEYEITCIDRGTNPGRLVREYVNMFQKLKQESFGYPFLGSE
jgi:hypothetical protein